MQTLDYYLDPLQPFLRDETMSEVVINKPGEVWGESPAGWTCCNVPKMDFPWLSALAQIAGNPTKQSISPEHPVLSCTLPAGERCQIVIPPAVQAQTVSLTIRKPSKKTFSLAEFQKNGLFDQVITQRQTLSVADQHLRILYEQKNWLEFFDLAVKSHKNIIISGATGSGKTTFSKALIQCIPLEERIISIEDTQELDIPHPNSVRLFYSKDGMGLSKAGPKQLLESCLRMRPDRILLQELRDGTAFFYLRNVNSGHPGSITTVHADSAALAFEQLSLLIKESEGGSDLERADIKSLLRLLVDIVVQIKRDKDGKRRITEVFFEPEGRGAG